MKWLGTGLILAIILALITDDAFAHGRGRWRGHIGVFVGAPLFVPWYYPRHYDYPPAYYYSNPPVAPTYIERGDAGTDPGGEDFFWYRCENPSGYYPYVKECPAGWQKEIPRPPNG